MTDVLKVTTKGQGIPLVLIHGWGLNSGIWQPLVNKLAPYLKVITIDLPGYGTNIDHTIASYCLADIARQVVQAVNEPAIYAGWSLGGLVATEIATEYKSASLGLVTIASSPCFVAQSLPQPWPGIKANLLADFHRQLSQDTGKTIAGFLKIQAMGSPHIRQDLKEIKQLIMQYDTPQQQVLDDSLALLETVDLRQKLSDINIPFLRLYGRLDSLIPKTVIPLVDELAPKSVGHVFAKASHAPFISHAEDFFNVLLSWLASTYIEVKVGE